MGIVRFNRGTDDVRAVRPPEGESFDLIGAVFPEHAGDFFLGIGPSLRVVDQHVQRKKGGELRSVLSIVEDEIMD